MGTTKSPEVVPERANRLGILLPLRPDPLNMETSKNTAYQVLSPFQYEVPEFILDDRSNFFP